MSSTTPQSAPRSHDPNIGEKILIVRRKQNLNQTQVTEHLQTACGRKRSPRWLSSVESGAGVIYEDEVRELETWWNVDFGEINIGPDLVRDPRGSGSDDFENDKWFTNDRNEYFQLQEERLHSGNYELWFTSPPLLLFLKDEGVRKKVVSNVVENEVKYCFVWLLDFYSNDDFRYFHDALGRVCEHIPQREGSPKSFFVYPVYGFQPKFPDSDIQLNSYEAARADLNKGSDFIQYHEPFHVNGFNDPAEAYCLNQHGALGEASLCFFLPAVENLLLSSQESPAAVLQFSRMGKIGDMDITADGQGWGLLERNITSRVESAMRQLKAAGNS